MDFQRLVSEARSCRRFVQAKRVTQEDTDRLMACASQVPCARNAQVLRYIVVRSPEKCAEVFSHTHWAGALKEWGGPVEGERPTAYIAVLCPKDCISLVYMDVGIASQTIQLEAHTLGIGCCMHASFNKKACATLLRVPENMQIALLLALGAAKEERRLAPMPADGNFNYWRDKDEVHFVPKRTPAELVLAQF